MLFRILLLLAFSLPALAQTTIVTRAGKGSALTWAEVDANFTNLKATADAAASKSANLSDLTNATLARSNLGLGSAATSSASAFEVPLTFAARLSRSTNTIDLAASGVTAGSCTLCDLTIDAYGRVTAKSNGTGGGGGDAVTSGTLAQFASTTSAELAGVISNETGSGALVFATSPALTTPDLGTPSAIALTNATSIPAGQLTGSIAAARMPALTGDVTTSAGAVATTLATVNGNVGTFGSATKSSVVTVNGKGLVTAASESTVTPAIGSVTGLGTGVATALGTATNSSGGPVTGGAITSSGLTQATGKLLGRSTASTGAIEEITVGSGLSLSGGSLTASGGGGQGTSFPGSPASGARFFRTDLGLDCYYDGTRWLTVQQYTQPVVFGYSAPAAASATDSAYMQGIVDQRQAGMWIDSVLVDTYVSTTNTGSAYWTVQLRSTDAPATTFHNLGSSFTTGTTPDTADRHTAHTITVGAAVTSGDKILTFQVTKTSTPGNLIVQATAYYRLIVT